MGKDDVTRRRGDSSRRESTRNSRQSIVAPRSGVKNATDDAKKNTSVVDDDHKGPKFAEGMNFRKLFFIFLIGSVIGAIYEDVLIFVRTWMNTGTGVWMLHRGVIYGPFNVIYGFGAAVLCWLLARKDLKIWQIFIWSALAGGAVEFIVSYLQEVFTHTKSWDYSGQWLSLDGRTTVPIMAIWGLMGLILIKVIYPLVSRLIEAIPVRTGEILFTFLLIFMIFNMLISWSAIIRRMMRHNNIKPVTPVGEFLDQYYPDSYLEKYFPNMVWSEKK